MILRGPTLTLRYPMPDDAPQLFELARDPEVTRWFSWGPYRSVDEPLDWIAEQEARREAGRQLDFVIEHGAHGVIGVTGLNELSRRDRRAMVGTWLGRDRWGSGANAESKAVVTYLAFTVCGLDRVGAYSNPANERSTAALERLGFVREGTLRRWHRHGGEPRDVHAFGLLREEWEGSPLAAVDVGVDGTPPAAWLVG